MREAIFTHKELGKVPTYIVDFYIQQKLKREGFDLDKPIQLMQRMGKFGYSEYVYRQREDV